MKERQSDTLSSCPVLSERKSYQMRFEARWQRARGVVRPSKWDKSVCICNYAYEKAALFYPSVHKRTIEEQASMSATKSIFTQNLVF